MTLIWQNALSKSPVQTTVSVLTGMGLTLVLMVLIWDMFIPLGRLLGRLLEDHPRTIWGLLGERGGKPGGDLAVRARQRARNGAGGLVRSRRGLAGGIDHDCRNPAATKNDRRWPAGLVVLAWIAGREPGSIEVRWSPYQKLVLYRDRQESGRFERHRRLPGHCEQHGLPGHGELERAVRPGAPRYYPRGVAGLSQYDLPFLFHSRPRSALLVGAGTGNDAAGHCDTASNRSRPWRSTRRSSSWAGDITRKNRMTHRGSSSSTTSAGVLRNHHDRFDVIVFGLLDSHTTTAMTNARLDHYVYTKESLTHARSLLADGGVMVLSFEAQKPYVADRMASVLHEVFGAQPLLSGCLPRLMAGAACSLSRRSSGRGRRPIAANPRWPPRFRNGKLRNP